MTEEKVARFCRENRMLPQGSRVTAAVSGGADSMALLHLLLRLRETFGFTLCAAHFNHRLRGEEADRDERFVRERCAALGIPLVTDSGDVTARAETAGESIEEAARKLRYAFFDSLDTDFVATAHNADDNAETLLLNLLRGTGPRGLCGIPPVRGKLVRPLLTLTRGEIEAYLAENGIPHVEDSTNADNSCVRNRIRHKVMPLLKEENPRFSEAVLRTAQLQREEEAFLSALAANAAEECRDGDALNCAALRGVHPVLRRRILLSALRERRPEIPARKYVDALEQLVFSDNPSARIAFPERLTAAREYDRLLFREGGEEPGTFSPAVLHVPGEAILPGTGLKVSCYFTKNSSFCRKNPHIFYLKCDMISETVLLRPRKTGDAMNGKTVKKQMIDRKIPAARRGLCPVMETGGKIAAVYGLGVNRAFAPEEDGPALCIAFREADES